LTVGGCCIAEEEGSEGLSPGSPDLRASLVRPEECAEGGKCNALPGVGKYAGAVGIADFRQGLYLKEKTAEV
jgi:hypothetical protein